MDITLIKRAAEETGNPILFTQGMSIGVRSFFEFLCENDLLTDKKGVSQTVEEFLDDLADIEADEIKAMEESFTTN